MCFYLWVEDKNEIAKSLNITNMAFIKDSLETAWKVEIKGKPTAISNHLKQLCIFGVCVFWSWDFFPCTKIEFGKDFIIFHNFF